MEAEDHEVGAVHPVVAVEVPLEAVGAPWMVKLAIWRSIVLGGVARSRERRPTVTMPLSGAGGR